MVAPTFGWSVGDLIQAINVATEVYQAFRYAPAELKDLSDEFERVYLIVSQLKELLKVHGQPAYSGYQAYAKTVNECREFVDKYTVVGSQTWSVARITRTAAWPLVKRESDRLSKDLRGHAHCFGLYLSVLTSDAIFEERLVNLETRATSQQILKILHELSARVLARNRNELLLNAPDEIETDTISLLSVESKTENATGSQAVKNKSRSWDDLIYQLAAVDALLAKQEEALSGNGKLPQDPDGVDLNHIINMRHDIFRSSELAKNMLKRSKSKPGPFGAQGRPSFPSRMAFTGFGAPVGRVTSPGLGITGAGIGSWTTPVDRPQSETTDVTSRQSSVFSIPDRAATTTATTPAGSIIYRKSSAYDQDASLLRSASQPYILERSPEFDLGPSWLASAPGLSSSAPAAGPPHAPSPELLPPAHLSPSISPISSAPPSPRRPSDGSIHRSIQTSLDEPAKTYVFLCDHVKICLPRNGRSTEVLKDCKIFYEQSADQGLSLWIESPQRAQGALHDFLANGRTIPYVANQSIAPEEKLRISFEKPNIHMKVDGSEPNIPPNYHFSTYEDLKAFQELVYGKKLVYGYDIKQIRTDYGIILPSERLRLWRNSNDSLSLLTRIKYTNSSPPVFLEKSKDCFKPEIKYKKSGRDVTLIFQPEHVLSRRRSSFSGRSARPDAVKSVIIDFNDTKDRDSFVRHWEKGS